MRLLFDEDLGKGVPEALRNVGINATHVRRVFKTRIARGEAIADEDWIPFAGKDGLLVISCNTAILESDAQRDLWIDNGVGGVFLTSGQERKIEVLKLILRKLDWLETIDAKQPRPFAFRMTISGRRPRLDPRISASGP